MLQRLSGELGYLTRLVRAVAARFDEDRCTRVAGALSFTTVLALVPLTAIVFAVLSVFPVFEPIMNLLEDFVYANFVPAAGEVVQKYLQQFAANAGRLTAWGLLFLAVTSLMLMATIEQTFNDIWHAPPRRQLLNRFLTYWALLTLGPILIGASLSITSYVVSLPLFTTESLLSGFRAFVLGMLPALFELLAFLLAYTVVPNQSVRLRHAIVGAVVAVVLFECAKRGFALFVHYFSSYRKVYGALAALPIFLIWIYVSWVVILLGAVVTAVVPTWHTAGNAAPSSGTEGSVREKLLRRRRRIERRY